VQHYCNTLPHTATHRITLQHTATHCNTLQHTATHCNTLPHTYTHASLNLHSSLSLMHTHKERETHTHTRTGAHTLKHAHTRTHTNTCARTHTHTRTHVLHTHVSANTRHFGRSATPSRFFFAVHSCTVITREKIVLQAALRVLSGQLCEYRLHVRANARTRARKAFCAFTLSSAQIFLGGELHPNILLIVHCLQTVTTPLNGRSQKTEIRAHQLAFPPLSRCHRGRIRGQNFAVTPYPTLCYG